MILPFTQLFLTEIIVKFLPRNVSPPIEARLLPDPLDKILVAVPDNQNIFYPEKHLKHFGRTLANMSTPKKG